MFKRGEKEKEELFFLSIKERLLSFTENKHTIADIIIEFNLKNYKQVYRCLRFIGGEDLLLKCKKDSKLHIADQKSAIKRGTKKRKQEEKLRNPKQKKKKLYKNKEIFDKYQALFAEKQIELRALINVGNGMQQIIDALGLGSFYWLYKYFDWVNDIDLYNKCKENSKQYVKELGRIKCTAPNAPRLKQALIPKEIEEKYLELRDLGWHKEKIKSFFKENYKGTRFYFKRLYAQYPLVKYNHAGKPLKSSKHRRAGGKIGYVIINNMKLLYRSSLELRCFLQLELMGVTFKAPNFKIPYIDEDGISRNYYPDVIIGDNLVEIKPYAYMSTGYNISKYRAARLYCEENDLYFSVWNELHIRYKPTYEELVQMVKTGKLIPNTPIETYEKLVKNWNFERRIVNALSDINMAFIWKDQFSPKFGIAIPEKYQIIIDKYKGIKNEKRIKQ